MRRSSSACWEDPFGADLDDVVRGETLNRHALAVERYHKVAEVRDCQICSSLHQSCATRGILAVLKGRSILTVTDAMGLRCAA